MAEGLDPDEPCGVCGVNRDAHGDTRHEFSAEGVLKEKAAPPPPRNIPPMPQMIPIKDARVDRLIATLTDKGILDAKDLLVIFGATDAPDRGSAQG